VAGGAAHSVTPAATAAHAPQCCSATAEPCIGMLVKHMLTVRVIPSVHNLSVALHKTGKKHCRPQLSLLEHTESVSQMLQRPCSDSALNVLAMQAYAYCLMMPMLSHTEYMANRAQHDETPRDVAHPMSVKPRRRAILEARLGRMCCTFSLAEFARAAGASPYHPFSTSGPAYGQMATCRKLLQMCQGTTVFLQHNLGHISDVHAVLWPLGCEV